MPTILVMSNASTEQGSNVTLAETVEPEQLASDHHAAARLIERVAWALTDAKDAEETSDPLPGSGLDTPLREGGSTRRSSQPPAEERADVDPRNVEDEVYESLYGRRIR